MKKEKTKVGDKFYDHVGEIRVMAIAETYAMVRRPHAVPFTIRVKDLRLFSVEPVNTEPVIYTNYKLAE